MFVGSLFRKLHLFFPLGTTWPTRSFPSPRGGRDVRKTCRSVSTAGRLARSEDRTCQYLPVVTLMPAGGEFLVATPVEDRSKRTEARLNASFSSSALLPTCHPLGFTEDHEHSPSRLLAPPITRSPSLHTSCTWLHSQPGVFVCPTCNRGRGLLRLQARVVRCRRQSTKRRSIGTARIPHSANRSRAETLLLLTRFY